MIKNRRQKRPTTWRVDSWSAGDW